MSTISLKSFTKISNNYYSQVKREESTFFFCRRTEFTAEKEAISMLL